MLHASIAQVPVFGGKLKSYDEAKIKGMRGVKKVVAADDWIAVVADNWWRANQALKAMPIEWNVGDNGKVTSASIMEFVRTGLDAKEAPVARKDGDYATAIGRPQKCWRLSIMRRYMNHATLEPQTTTAWLNGDRLEVWVGTQNGETSIAAASEISGIPLEKVIVHKMHAGGGFGRRRFAGVREASGADRPGDARHAGAFAMVARGGHAARSLSSGVGGKAKGWIG